MKGLRVFFPLFAVFLGIGICGSALAEDVVYLKDGSIIHGAITEEVPGKTIKIETKDGNVFVYKMKAIDKITHTAAPATSAAPADSNTGSSLVSQGTPAAQPAPVAAKADPNARFNKFGFLLSAGFWGPNTYTQFNNDLEAGTGTTSYDYLPGFAKFGLGLGWFTNNFGLKWNFQFSLNPNDYTTNYYYGGYYAGSTTESTYIFIGGTELEGELALDSVTNKDVVTSVYLPLIVGIWNVDYNITDSFGSDDFSNTTSDFGTGIGFRGFDSSNFLWDLQFVYRWSNRGNYLEDSKGLKIPYVNGKFIDANVSGPDLNITIGFLM
jgi:hypothetical protein